MTYRRTFDMFNRRDATLIIGGALTIAGALGAALGWTASVLVVRRRRP